MASIPPNSPTVTRTVTVGANTVERVGLAGKFFYCRSATAAFTVLLGNEAGVSANAGQQVASRGFGEFVLQNDTTNPNAIEFVVSAEPVVDNRPTTAVVTTTAKDPATYTKASAAAANATTTFSGLDTAAQRKQIVVQNAEKSVADGGTGQYIEVGDTTNTSGVRLQLAPGQMFTLVSNGVVKVTVPSGCTAGVVFETFYS